MGLGGSCAGLAILVGLAPILVDGGTSRGPEVDLALVLAVDVSSSMNEAEQLAQRSGYVAALRSTKVAGAIASGRLGKVAVTYMEWAGTGYQAVRVPWTVLSNPTEMGAFADRLAASPTAGGPATSISAALRASEALLQLAPSAERRAIDVSGDGPNNAGAPIDGPRNRLLAEDVTINGLVISLPRSGAGDLAESFGAGFVRAYYEDCVIGGPAAFVIPVDDAARFEAAILDKLVLEIAGATPSIIPAAFHPASRARVDCATVGMVPGR